MRASLFAGLVLLGIVASDRGGEQAKTAPPLPRLPFDAAKATALQEEWARAFGCDVRIVNSIGLKLVLIPGGRFDMGPNGSTYRVTLAKPFYLGVTEVTLGEYRKFRPGHKVPGADDEFNADDRPAAMVSWHDARAFCAWLSELTEE